MKSFKLKTPVGFKDYVLKDMEKKNKISDSLKSVFKGKVGLQRGYARIGRRNVQPDASYGR